MKRLWLDQEDL